MVRDKLPRRKVIASLTVGTVAGLAGCSSEEQVTVTEAPDETESGGGQDESTETDETEGNDVPGEAIAVEIITPPRDNDPTGFEASQLLKNELEELGITVTLDAMPFNSAVEVVINNQNYDVWSVGWSASPERLDPSFWFNTVYHSGSIGGYNSMLYNNPELDEVADQQVQTYDYEERKALVDECQRITTENPPAIPMTSEDIVELYNTDTIASFGPQMAGQGIKGFWNMLEMKVNRNDNVYRGGQTDTIQNPNPLDVRTTFNRQTWRLLYDRLFRMGPDLSPEPWVAEGYEQVDDTTFRITLKDEDFRFHDGEPMTAEDIAFSYEYQQEHSGVTSTFIEQVDSVEIIDDLTLRFNLNQKSATFLTNGISFPFILPKHIWEDIPDSVDAESAMDWQSDLIGSGPFKFDTFTRGEELRLTANEDYWRDPPNVDGYVAISGPKQSIHNLLEEGTLDAVNTGASWSVSAIERLTEIDFIGTYEQPTWGFTDMDLNCLNTPKKDPSEERPTSFLAIRRAIHHVTPKEQLLQNMLGGKGSVEHTFVASANEQWHNSDIPEYGLTFTGHEQARAELEDAGFTWDDEGLLHFPE